MLKNNIKPMKDTEHTMTTERLTKYIEDKCQHYFATKAEDASPGEIYYALGRTVRDIITEKWTKTKQQYKDNDVKQIYYLSMEFLIGRTLGANLFNLGMYDIYRESAKQIGADIDKIRDAEKDAGLGSGGLGRLAACFLESLATLELPGHGYGMRYEYGMFDQRIENGYQHEYADKWLEEKNIWEFKVPDEELEVRFGGHLEYHDRGDGNYDFIHKNYSSVKAIPYDLPVVGYKNNTANTLRLWAAEAINEFDFKAFSSGNFMTAVKEKNMAEQICLVLYPEDSHYEGKLLRLKQQYFFVSASIQDIVRKYKMTHENFDMFPDKICIQLNDTHPSLSVPELMRILLDEEKMGWDEAWDIVTRTIAFTNHTIMPEALEQWDCDMVKGLYPRIYQIIEEIDRRYFEYLRLLFKNDYSKMQHMCIIKDNKIRMAFLSIIGSFSVNGVAELHTEILKNVVFKHFYEQYPHKFNNKTNGVTLRRWLLKTNMELSDLITKYIGDKWIVEADELQKLLAYTKDEEFKNQVKAARLERKKSLAEYIMERNNIQIDINSMIEIQCKRMHEYKRQLLVAFYAVYLYNSIKANPDTDIPNKTIIFSGKAAANYRMSKLIIKFINNIADKVNSDPEVNRKLKIVFLENFRVSLAEKLYPAADISLQVSTASKEASGTGNMKFMLNGALTLGTLDGANVEIAEEAGMDNCFIFGLKANEVLDYYKNKNYHPQDIVNNDQRLKLIMSQMIDGSFINPGEPRDLFRDIYDSLLTTRFGNADNYFVVKDFASFIEAHERADEIFKDESLWYEKTIINIAKSGKFSSDRTIKQYANEIWGVKKTPII